MTTDEQLDALGQIILRLQRENDQLRDTLAEVIGTCGYFIKQANPKAYQQAEEALDCGWRTAFREGDRDEFDDSFMDRLSDDDDTEEDEE
jgi:hypothetical protein